MSTIRVDNVSKSFGGVPVLKGVDFSAAEGEMVSLLGPSGCGKSTTLRCIAGFESIDSGEIRIGGSLVSSGRQTVPPEQRHLGIVFQNYAIWPHMTVAENVAFGLRVKRVSSGDMRQQIADVLQVTGLTGLESRYPAQLSGGQQQRVAIARSLVVRPTVLLFDEPLSNLDAKLRDRMRTEIRAIQQRVGITSVYVTHDQAEALSMSDRIMLMNAGTIVEAGTPRQLYEAPNTEFAAQFLGSVNLLKAEVVRKDPAGTLLRLADGYPLLVAGEQPFGEGQSCLGMVRPNMIAFVQGAARAEPTAADGSTEWPAVVSAFSYLGATAEITCQVGDMTIHATVPSHDIPSTVASGTACTLRIPSRHVRLLAKE